MVRKITIIFSIAFFWMTGFAQQRTDSVHVAHYDINLSVTDFTSKVIDGYTDISVVAKVGNLTQVRLDLMVLTVDSVRVNQNPATFSHVGQSLLVNVPAMQSGDTALIRVPSSFVTEEASEIAATVSSVTPCFNTALSEVDNKGV